MVLIFGITISGLKNVRWLRNQIDADQLLVKEAIYDTTTLRHHDTFIEIYENNKLSYVHGDFKPCESLNKDKVIVLPVRGQKWVFKAR